MKTINIKGHSGCKVEVVNDKGTLYIKKSTDSQDYMHRFYLPSPILSHTLRFQSCTQVRLLMDVLVAPLSWFHLPGS